MAELELYVEKTPELSPTEGEDPWSYLHRTSMYYLEELARLGMDQSGKIPAKVKLEALKELLNRIIPAKTIYEIGAGYSAIDKMSDAECAAYLREQLEMLEGKS